MRLFKGKQQQIVELVHKAGATGIRSDRLFALLHQGDPNGGPLTGIKVLAVQVCQINRYLKAVGRQIRGGRSGHGAFTNYVMHTIRTSADKPRGPTCSE